MAFSIPQHPFKYKFKKRVIELEMKYDCNNDVLHTIEIHCPICVFDHELFNMKKGEQIFIKYRRRHCVIYNETFSVSEPCTIKNPLEKKIKIGDYFFFFFSFPSSSLFPSFNIFLKKKKIKIKIIQLKKKYRKKKRKRKRKKEKRMVYKKYWAVSWLYWSGWFILFIIPGISFIVSQILESDIASLVFGILFFLYIAVQLGIMRWRLRVFYKKTWEQRKEKIEEDGVDGEHVRIYKNHSLWVIINTILLLVWFFLQWKSYLRCADHFPSDIVLCWRGFSSIFVSINGTAVEVFKPNLNTLVPIVILHVIVIVLLVLYLFLWIAHFFTHFKSVKFQMGTTYREMKEDLIEEEEEDKFDKQKKIKQKKRNRNREDQYKIDSVLGSLRHNKPSPITYNIDSLTKTDHISTEDELAKLEKEIKEPLQVMHIDEPPPVENTSQLEEQEELMDEDNDQKTELEKEMDIYKINKYKDHNIQPNV